MTPHNEAAVGDYAEIVLLPGDPLRAKWIAENFFDNAEGWSIRSATVSGFTGTFKGTPVSVQATGMGQPSTAIYVHELLDVYKAKTLDPGWYQRRTDNGREGARHRARHKRIDRQRHQPSCVCALYLCALCRFCSCCGRPTTMPRAHGLTCHTGGLVSSDTFYLEEPAGAYATLARHGVLAVEMEASTIYTLARRFGARALAICTVSDCLITGEEIAPEGARTFAQRDGRDGPGRSCPHRQAAAF